ncbi:hypothetical protein [Rhodanobacter sp. C05]|uniref:hypothetical protein n=1 Tax=Rhodanobacter sp. C05 TaxID=1945855 RepID=UPI000986F806|nr:hypothetical protein [Rhodanobacter sp. C05]OOG39366.1 hypothetical protein B0E51_12560 [Rhodanobacter sp. C05]
MKFAGIRWLISAVAVLIAVGHFVWPSFSLDTTYIIALVIAFIPWLAPVIKSVELPGGFKIEVQDLKEITDKLTGMVAEPEHSPRVDAAPPQQQQQYRPQQSQHAPASVEPFIAIRQLAATDPNLALVAFRIELERCLVSLAQRHGLATQRQDAGQLLRQLQVNQAITPAVASGLAELLALCNQAAHGAEVSPGAAQWMLDVGPGVLAALEG